MTALILLLAAPVIVFIIVGLAYALHLDRKVSKMDTRYYAERTARIEQYEILGLRP